MRSVGHRREKRRKESAGEKKTPNLGNHPGGEREAVSEVESHHSAWCLNCHQNPQLDPLSPKQKRSAPPPYQHFFLGQEQKERINQLPDPARVCSLL